MDGSGNILFCGVGGQGVLLASEITSRALMMAGFEVRKSEVHGMAQRGGTVEAHLRYGSIVYSPLIEPGTADILVAFELIEAMRYLPCLKKDGKVIVSNQMIAPPSVINGSEEYPEGIVSRLRDRGVSVHEVDALAFAVEEGEPMIINLVLVGAMSGFLPVSEELFEHVIAERVKKDYLKINLEAFRRGRGIN